MNSSATASRASIRAASPSKMLSTVLPDLHEVERRIEQAKASKQYKQAQALENELNQLRRALEDRQLQELEQQQARELAACEEDHQAAYQRLMEVWSGRMSELQQQLQQAEQQLLLCHEEETAALLAAQAAYPARPKFSPALLNMRRIECTLAQQKEFDKADKVREQADQLEEMELSQSSTNMAARIEVERTRLATQHSKEREATTKKTNSALLSAQQRLEYEVEQLTRRFQAVKLSLTRAHAAQRISLQQNLRGSLGIKKPSKLLGLPSFNSSLTETRGLIPQPATKTSTWPPGPPESSTINAAGGGRCRSPLGELQRGAAGSPVGSSRCKSPVNTVDRALAPSPTRSCGSTSKGTKALCNPDRVLCYDPYEHGSHSAADNPAPVVWDASPAAKQIRAGIAADAAAAAAGLGMVTMPPLSRTSSSPKAKSPVKASDDVRPYTHMGNRLPGTQAAAAGGTAGTLLPACNTAGRPKTRAAAADSRAPGNRAPAGVLQQPSNNATTGTNTSSEKAVSSNTSTALRPTARRGPVHGDLSAVAEASEGHSSLYSSSSGLNAWDRPADSPSEAGGHHALHSVQPHLEHGLAVQQHSARTVMGAVPAAHSIASDSAAAGESGLHAKQQSDTNMSSNLADDLALQAAAESAVGPGEETSSKLDAASASVNPRAANPEDPRAVDDTAVDNTVGETSEAEQYMNESFEVHEETEEKQSPEQSTSDIPNTGAPAADTEAGPNTVASLPAEQKPDLSEVSQDRIAQDEQSVQQAAGGDGLEPAGRAEENQTTSHNPAPAETGSQLIADAGSDAAGAVQVDNKALQQAEDLSDDTSTLEAALQTSRQDNTVQQGLDAQQLDGASSSFGPAVVAEASAAQADGVAAGAEETAVD